MKNHRTPSKSLDLEKFANLECYDLSELCHENLGRLPCGIRRAIPKVSVNHDHQSTATATTATVENPSRRRHEEAGRCTHSLFPSKPNHLFTTKGFTLVEIMIVVAIIGLVAAIAIPSMLRSRKLSQGTCALQVAREMDDAITRWAVDYNKKEGDAVDLSTLQTYYKKNMSGKDVLGNMYIFGGIGTNQVVISPSTKAALAGAGIDWGPY